jgi:hypothetical protein
MKHHCLHVGFWALAGAALQARASDSQYGPADSCYCLPEDACWPSSTEWDSLNTTVNGRLVATKPLGSVCHDPSYDEAACEALKAAWRLPDVQYVPESSVPLA